MSVKIILNSKDRVNRATSANDCEYYINWGSILDEGKYRVNYSICKQIFIPPLTFSQLLINKPPWARYDASSLDATTQILSDLTPNGRNAVCSGVVVSTQLSAINGSGALLSGLTGSITSTIQFPVGSVPPVHTICFITRYRTALANRKRILVTELNHFFGHNTPTLRGIVNYGDVIIANAVTTEPAINYLNMCVCSSGIPAPNNVLVNGVPNGLTGIAPIAPFSSTLAINIGTTEVSGFELNQMIIWDRALTSEEMVLVSNTFGNYLATGVLV